MSGDGRIPLYILSERDAMPQELVRVQGEGACLAVDTERPGGWAVYRRIAANALPGRVHARFCACCAGRSPVASALDQLFLDRIRGTSAHFVFVVIICGAGRLAGLMELLQQDAMVRSRYRI
ncbi:MULTISPECIES: hypothetical protein [Asaia]|uniref:hypothetical protein n=1 Tax=Asaia TaxID=91914 RepID=UPI0025530F69|nr:hypothetical protein [Asaia sp. HumB]MDL2171661.1 hypothetical protein [Asaia sp. HumB]